LTLDKILIKIKESLTSHKMSGTPWINSDLRRDARVASRSIDRILGRTQIAAMVAQVGLDRSNLQQLKEVQDALHVLAHAPLARDINERNT
jgi:hypothetical protein